MMVELVNYTRKPKEILYEYDNGEIVARWHEDRCPNCDERIEWVQGCEVWTEDENGVMQPDFDGTECWHAECPHCGAHSADPYGDGLVRVWIA